MAGAANTIAYNGKDGVLVDAGGGNAIQQNSIFAHTNALGIELVNGGNNSQPFPTLTSVSSGNGMTTIQGLLQGFAANTTFTLEFYADTVCNPSGYGEGERFLGLLSVTTDDNGNATFTATFNVEVPQGQFVSATATDPGNNTSQFAQCLLVPTPTAPPGNGSRATPIEPAAASALLASAGVDLACNPPRSVLPAHGIVLPQGSLDLYFSGLWQDGLGDHQGQEFRFAGWQDLGLRGEPGWDVDPGWEQDFLLTF